MSESHALYNADSVTNEIEPTTSHCSRWPFGWPSQLGGSFSLLGPPKTPTPPPPPPPTPTQHLSVWPSVYFHHLPLTWPFHSLNIFQLLVKKLCSMSVSVLPVSNTPLNWDKRLACSPCCDLLQFKSVCGGKAWVKVWIFSYSERSHARTLGWNS